MSEGADQTLQVERTGGFGGLTLRARVPLAELRPDELTAIEECLRHPSSPPSGPDRFVYRLRLHGREGRVQEDQLPHELHDLVDRLSWR